MKYLYIFLLACGFLACDSDCNSDIEIGTITPERTIFSVPDSIFNFIYKVEPGENLLFTFTHHFPECINIDDDEAGQEITFEVPHQLISFDFEGIEMAQLNAFYREIGAWAHPDWHSKIMSGRINGEKMSESEWNVNLSILVQPRFEDERRVEYNGRFSI